MKGSGVVSEVIYYHHSVSPVPVLTIVPLICFSDCDEETSDRNAPIDLKCSSGSGGRSIIRTWQNDFTDMADFCCDEVVALCCFSLLAVAALKDGCDNNLPLQILTDSSNRGKSNLGK